MATKQAEKYKQQGNEAFKKGDHAKAIEFYTYATEMDPNNPVFFTNRSNAYFQMKKYEKSERDALKAIKKNANWEKGYYRLGAALQAQEKYEDALKAFKQATDLKPDNATFKNAYRGCKAAMTKGMSAAELGKIEGNDNFKQGQIDQAIACYTQAIQAVKNTEKDRGIKVDCLANRAACYRQQYLPDKCIEDCTAALDIDPNHVKCLIRRGQAYESMEKYKKALADFNNAARLDSGNTLAMNSATRIRQAMKKLGLL